MGSIEHGEIIATPAVFFDRDGTLIEEVNFLSKVEEMRLFGETFSALKRLKDAGFLLIVVTNQSGIGRGFYSVTDMDRIHTAMQEKLDGMIDAFYYCPHLPDAGCECRKPRLGMIRLAERDHSIDIGRSWMIGDKALDINFGINAALSTILVSTGYGKSVKVTNEVLPNHFASSIGQAASIILSR